MDIVINYPATLILELIIVGTCYYIYIFLLYLISWQHGMCDLIKS